MTEIYLDCANLDQMREGRQNSLVRGFTTNPSICRAAGVTDYEAFCREALSVAEGLPVSLEVFADDMENMERQARIIASWGTNAVVKIPVTNTKGESTASLVCCLSEDEITCNVTAVFTHTQIMEILNTVNKNDAIIISVFAGRIADTGRDPFNAMISYSHLSSNARFLWASPREVLNITQAEQSGCQIITVTPDLLAKYEKLKGKDLTEFSLDTVKMFYDDATKAGYVL